MEDFMQMGALLESNLPKRPVNSDISIVIPTLGRDVLEEVLHATALGNIWPFELLLIDQGENANVSAWVKHLQEAGLNVRHLKKAKEGVANARNFGISHVKTKRVAFFDDDCVPDVNWLSAMVHLLNEHSGAIITGQVLSPEGGIQLSLIADPTPKKHQFPSLKEDVLYSGNMGFRLDQAAQIGPFDESKGFQLAAEDNDWAYRALKQSIPIIYSPKPKVIHLDWRNHEQLNSTYQNYARGQGVFYGKYIRQRDWFILQRAIRDQLRGVMRWTLGILRQDPDSIMSGRALTLYLLPGIIQGVREGQND